LHLSPHILTRAPSRAQLAKWDVSFLPQRSRLRAASACAGVAMRQPIGQRVYAMSAVKQAGQISPTTDEKTQGIAAVLAELGHDADPEQVVREIEARTGWQLDAGEVGALIAALQERSETPPPLDQPPPENARGRNGE
jgi:hypothetical protein